MNQSSTPLTTCLSTSPAVPLSSTTPFDPAPLKPIWQAAKKLRREDPSRYNDPLQLGTALRKTGFDPELISQALTFSDLQTQAIKTQKFPPTVAENLLFRRDSLEQATRYLVAAQHAARYAAAGIKVVADLGCGIGSESLALAQAGLHPVPVEINPQIAALAAHNLHPFPVFTADATTLSPQNFDPQPQAVICDPARRRSQIEGSKRLDHPESWLPPLSTAWEWEKLYGAVGVKVAPGLEHQYIPANARAEWTSVDRQLIECTLWSKLLAPEGAGRTATIIKTNRLASSNVDSVNNKSLLHNSANTNLSNYLIPSQPTLNTQIFTLASETMDPRSPVEFLNCYHPIESQAQDFYIFEPDPAVIRAGLISLLPGFANNQSDYGLVDPKIAYVLATYCPTNELKNFGQSFHVHERLALNSKNLAKSVANVLINIKTTNFEIKTRGLGLVELTLRKQITTYLHKKLKTFPTSKTPVTIILTKHQGQATGFLATRI